MTRKIRVLVVDDSMVVRRVVSGVLAEDPQIEVVDTAINGRLGVEKALKLKPDVVLMDIEMPEMDGLEALPLMRKSFPKMPIIMFSTLTQKGATATFRALSLGATDYIGKPTESANLDAAKNAIRSEILGRVRHFGAAYANIPLTKDGGTNVSTANPLKPIAPRSLQMGRAKSPIQVVAVGISTGGPNALEKFLPAFPKNFPLPILIVQHMPPMFTKMLADHLNGKCQIEVFEGKPGDTVGPGQAVIAPGGSHMVVVRAKGALQIATNMGPMENSCRPSVDVMFRSVLDAYGAGTLAVMMTGMGNDGFKACEMIYARGGQILAQDEETSVVWGMPGFVAKAGIADAVLPLDRLAPKVMSLVGMGLRVQEQPTLAMPNSNPSKSVVQR